MTTLFISHSSRDTSWYVDNFRTGRFTRRIVHSGFLFRGISIVIHETPPRGARHTDRR
jgi:hypothetical protein